VARARDADLFLTVGMEFELAVQGKLASLNSNMKTLDLAETVEKGGDLHVWLSLPLLSHMAERLEQELVRLDPDGQSVYRQNLTSYQERLASLDGALKKRLAPLRGTRFYVVHPAFGHFASDYGLKQAAVEVDGKSPTPKQLLSLIRRAREENVRVVFVQPQFDQRPAKMIADRINGRVVELNQLDEDPIGVIQTAAEEIERATKTP
jgi:zinc transport system substrate-binding protein